jgi:hypothetical protein
MPAVVTMLPAGWLLERATLIASPPGAMVVLAGV